MNILFLSLGKYWSVKESGCYTDLLREFIGNGHHIYVLSPIERREGKKAQRIKEDHSEILKVRTGNIQKTNMIEKGISTIFIERQFLSAIRTYYSDVRFDLVLYPTPPITFVKVVDYIRKRDGAKTYLLLKDIFPQNAVDIGLLSISGIKGLIYRHFRKLEKKLYMVSDRIGCMSQANVEYLLKQNPEIDRTKVEVCPNSIEVIDKSVSEETKKSIRQKYGIPIDRKVFVYGGNFGKPQGIPFVIECLKKCRDLDEAYFLIVGDGTEYHVLEEYVKTSKQANLKLLKRIPKEDYDIMIGACDVGLIFLDHRFTIPNFPSRLLGYMQARIPVLASTDVNTDIGNIITEGGFGWWCESNDSQSFLSNIIKIISSDLVTKGNNGYEYLKENYDVADSARCIWKGIENERIDCSRCTFIQNT